MIHAQFHIWEGGNETKKPQTEMLTNRSKQRQEGVTMSSKAFRPLHNQVSRTTVYLLMPKDKSNKVQPSLLGNGNSNRFGNERLGVSIWNQALLPDQARGNFDHPKRQEAKNLLTNANLTKTN
eukprot:5357731-Amphidinium_carterae.1